MVSEPEFDVMTEHAETNGGGGRGRGGGGGGGIKTLSLSLSLSFFLRLNNFENKDVFSPEKKKKKMERKLS